jgi:biopolymer transport protein TolR
MPKVQSFEHEKGGHSRRSRRTSSSLAEINVVPLVDVMLVLLIIFMVTAPMMQRGMEVKLPVSRRAEQISSERLFVTIPLTYRSDQRVLLDEEFIPVRVLAERTRQAMVAQTQKQVYLRMDAEVRAQEFMSVIDELKAGGVTDIGITTQFEPPRRQ